ncbi:LapA family protein [Tepidibacter hydrothermalis]|uniref:LapA family protein n=1 Tax=Tepidibacter hydrothermalis TaxID=3036126 RepID=A0ABY8EDQ7_9FIRM|nr:LapA family protein [Tepidibacter hydrothermalis]WFD08878.1 LapA family protein [Tepidibacter hydrothermalis]
MQFGFIISLIFAILVAVFAIQNSGIVAISFLFAKFNISQALVILISAALGAVIVMLLGFIKQIKLKLKIKEQSKKIKSLEEENKLFNNKIEEFKNSLDEKKIDSLEENKIDINE